MYQPPHFVEKRLDVLHALMRAHPLALLISSGPEGPVADLAPFLLDAEPAPHGRLRAHLARANPHWRLLAANPEAPVLIVFQGADSYVTPSWYETKRETGKVVPTWNYAVVHAHGAIRFCGERDVRLERVRELTERQETPRAHPWRVSDAPTEFLESMLKRIMAFEIALTRLVGKFKASQHRAAAERDAVRAALGAAGVATADLEEIVRSPPGRDP
jgi:transcriptional regulator